MKRLSEDDNSQSAILAVWTLARPGPHTRFAFFYTTIEPVSSGRGYDVTGLVHIYLSRLTNLLTYIKGGLPAPVLGFNAAVSQDLSTIGRSELPDGVSFGPA